MARVRLTALALLISAIGIGVGVADYLGAVFALTVFSAFGILWLLLPFSMGALSLKAEPAADVLYGEEGELRFTLIRRGLIPCGAVRLKLAFKNEYTGETGRSDVLVRLPKRGETGFSVKLALPHTGKMTVEVKRAWVYDLAGLLALPRILRSSCPFFVMPQVQRFPVGGILPQETEDSREPDPNRPGNSRPELFGVHEYAPGDALRDVHWKLSARLDKLMVREYVRPLGDGVGILLINGTGAVTPERANRLIDTAATLSLSLIETGIAHEMTWCERGTVRREKITSQEELYGAIRAVLSQPLCDKETLCGFLSGVKAAETRRIIVAACEEETVIRSLSVGANDMLLFIGEEVPPDFQQRILRHAALPENDGGALGDAFAALFEQGVRI